jgi:ATP-binding cassette subfamily F protein 3
MLRTVADTLYLVADGRAAPFDGDLEDYARWLAESAEKPAELAARADSAETRRQRKREDAERRQRLSPLKGEISRLEREVAQLGARRSAIEAELLRPEIYANDAKQRLLELLDS